MFSSRFHWDRRPNRLTELVRAKRAAGAEIYDLTESNPTHAGLDYPAALLNALADPRALRYDPVPAGLAEARTAVAGYYRARGESVNPARILLTASTSEAYAYLFKLLTNPGDEVLVPRPSYPLFEFLATMESVVVRQYPLVYDGAWSIDLAALEHEVNQRTRAIVLVNPNNPTGSYIRREEVERLGRLSAERGIALISDEVFADYAFGEPRHGRRSLCGVDQCLTFALSGLSKVAGLPQMKLGWMVVNGPAQLADEAFASLEWIADTYLSVSTPVQYAAASLLVSGDAVRTQIARRTGANLEWLRETVAGTSVSVLAVEGGWYAVLQVPRVRSDEEWALELLEQYHVLVQPGYYYDFTAEGFLVLSLLTPEAILRHGTYKILELA